MMTDRTITLRAGLVERLELLASVRGPSMDEVVSDLLERSPAPAKRNWALALAEAMEAPGIEWQDEPNASEDSRAQFERR